MKEETQEVTVIRFESKRRPIISKDYFIYSLKYECDFSIDEDPFSFTQAIESDNFENWINAMKEELKIMDDNNVWDLVDLPKGSKWVGCKWIFKTKRDSKGNIERYKARFVAKGFA